MAVPKLTLFAIVADDLAKSLAFYRRLGLDIPAEADSAPHVEVVLDGGLKLAWDSVETVRSYDAEWQAPTAGSHRFAVAFEFPDAASVDAKYKELVGAGYVGHIEPWDAVWGQHYAIVLDPDGNAVDLYSAL
ncbi:MULTISPECIES: VOC family protein [unclassified Streptomyces]|uniref:VOC family protein n=1 Tax=Streptomycetaceae TaxID=2062 RepID=UPI002E7A37A6|nr:MULTISPECIES: VOC family protein [unclassified Streptomyces]MED7953447.1 VOC family protein [Streptomyces sp. BE303]MEE1823087.1 VOC family protein [Streptomyces sp. BE20]